jgi:hypothetical protein
MNWEILIAILTPIGVGITLTIAYYSNKRKN